MMLILSYSEDANYKMRKSPEIHSVLIAEANDCIRNENLILMRSSLTNTDRNTLGNAAELLCCKSNHGVKMLKSAGMCDEPRPHEEANSSEPTPKENIQHLTDFIGSLQKSSDRSTTDNSIANPAPEMLSMANKMVRLHQLKDRNLGEELSALGEPVWKILLQLVIATEEDREASAADISHHLSIPETTAVRYIDILENKGFVIYSRYPTNQHSGQLSLTRQGRSILRDILCAMNTI